MIINGCQVESDTQVDCDVCIVGAGAAGITLARELQQQDLKIVLIESGNMQFDPAIDRLNQGEVMNEAMHGSLQVNRRRQLGGTTAIWGGRCVPFDESDFVARSHVPYSGWCFRKSELVSYYQRAHEHCEIGSYTSTPIDLLPAASRNRAMIPGLCTDELSTNELYLFSPPTHFGQRYLSELRQSRQISLFLNTNCLQLITTDDGGTIERLQVASIRQNKFSICAKRFVLAAGGLEVARLLLLSRQTHANGIGNQHDLVGRFYMSHLNYRFDVQFIPGLPIVWDYEKTRESIYCQRAIALSNQQQQQHKLLNHRVFIERPNVANPNHKNGVFSATYLTKALLRRQTRDLQGQRYDQVYGKANRFAHALTHGQNIVLGLPSVLPFSYKLLSKRLLSDRKLPSALAHNRANFYTLRMDSEQVPNPHSRVTLSSQQDCFGLNQLQVDWRTTEQDVQSIERSMQLIGEAFRRCIVGTIAPLTDVLLEPQGGHYLGTTRMSSSPSSGVVDENCRVYGVSNLFIASSSVFPTASYANPTLTIVALTIRLADYLKQGLAAPSLHFSAYPKR
ncbi:MAG: GMC family oxidoreductase [Drouetiella hepatica Uher 2000/2452]|uniref:GMC family oxidoreductase n=1 Tax=Drouetiella hepatica Uher 2000/2452 TaxID=904376 RepID=A0A951UNL6_9CYAN|nr:GMC family oxidoreductase [Drouetiella hepatica Uher 2000/2452]